MTNFVWVMAVILGIEVFCRVVCIAKQDLPRRSWTGFVWDAVLNGALLAWAVSLLVI